MTFRFAAPWFLVLLPVALLAAWALHRRRQTADARLALPGGAIRARMAGSVWNECCRGCAAPSCACS
jgi:hypothetical protein